MAKQTTTQTQTTPTTAAPVEVEDVYTCSNSKCGHRGSARQMVNLPLGRRGSRRDLLEGNLIFCRDCSRQGVRDFGLIFDCLDQTLRYLDRQEAAVAQRKMEANSIFQAVKAARSQNGNGQQSARDRRIAAQAARDAQQVEWDAARDRVAGNGHLNGASSSYEVYVG